MKKIKSLYKLARNVAFLKEYHCVYCNLVTSNYNKKWIKEHIYNRHDEYGIAVRIFTCKKCNNIFPILEPEILEHIAENH